MARTTVLITDHLQPIIDYQVAQLDTLDYAVPVGFGERPVTNTGEFDEPPYLVISYLPGGSLDGPISDSQADVSIRVLIASMGKTAKEASVLRDIAHGNMQKENISVTNRKVRDLKVDSPTDGVYRDDDAPTPIFYTRQIYLMDTTPA